MTESESIEPAPRPSPRGNPAAAVIVVGGIVCLLAFAAVVFRFLRTPPPPAPADVAGDPLLAEGRLLYLDRCMSCHGPSGRGDGPIAKGLSGPPVGDLTDTTWKHGDRPEQVEAVVSEGVTNASMPGWGRTLGPDRVRAVTAYVLYLAGRKVPAEWRPAKSQ
jgi:mono/diheme cytochrome c family protein